MGHFENGELQQPVKNARSLLRLLERNNLLPGEVIMVAAEVTIGCSSCVPVVAATVKIQVSGDHSCATTEAASGFALQKSI